VKKKMIGLGAAVFALLALPKLAPALTVGTFDMEDFHIAGTKGPSRASSPYTQNDVKELARAVRKSGAGVLALQGVEGDASMRFFIVTALPGWKFAGSDTADADDLYFLWDPGRAALVGKVSLLKTGVPLKYQPLCARFRDPKSGEVYTLVNAHLEKSAAPAQMTELYARAKTLTKPVILLGGCDELTSAPPEVDLRRLENGFSYDETRSNPDFIGFIGLPHEKAGEVKETETRIRRRSTKRRERPGHDIITVEISD